MQQSGRNIVLAVGMSFVILLGGIDLSVGAVLALSGVSMAMAMQGTLPGWLIYVVPIPIAAGVSLLGIRKLQKVVNLSYISIPRTGWIIYMPDYPNGFSTAISIGIFAAIEIVLGLLLTRFIAGGVKMEAGILIGLSVGTACGLLNGLTVSIGRVPSFVATLGMMSAARGLTLYATDGSSVTASFQRFMALGQGAPLVVITLVVVALGSLILTRLKLGRYTLAIGGSEQASRLSGVDVQLYKTAGFALCGLAAAIGGLLVTAKFGLADTNAGSGAELEAIAAVVIGGTSLSGGKGSIIGALVGALTITVIEEGLVLSGVKSNLQPVILGAVIVLTVFIDQFRQGSRLSNK